MSRKVFISFLGTSFYKECTYVKDGFSFRSRFIQEATFRYLSSMEEWTADDCIMILLTEQAEERNWKDDGHIDAVTGQVIKSVGLERVLTESGFPSSVKAIRHIPEGRNNDEINSVFESIFDAIKEGDQLYFDLTHAYRYLPMLILVLGNYAKFLKDVTVKSITYGNWEMSEQGTKPAPIINLLSLSILQDWTFAAGQYLQSGNVSELVRLNSAEYRQLLSASGGTDLDARYLRDFIVSLDNTVEQRQTCRGMDIVSAISIKQMRTAEKKLTVKNSLFSPIYKRIVEEFVQFDDNRSVANCFHAAEWCMKHGNYQQAATLLQEFFVSHLCELLGKPIDDNRETRFVLSKALNYAFDKYMGHHDPERPFEEREYPECCRNYGELIYLLYPDYVGPFRELSDLRNDLNHAGMRNLPKPIAARKIAGKLTELFGKFCPLLTPERQITPALTAPPLFINLSNHPSSSWSSAQLEAARRYGDIVDLPFPVIPPDADENVIQGYAQATLRKIVQTHLPPSTVHVMGEMTVTLLLVNALQSLGYTCIASTSARDVSVNEEGDKIAHFDFVRFREY